jgi:hypothetical protein
METGQMLLSKLPVDFKQHEIGFSVEEGKTQLTDLRQSKRPFGH